MRELRARLSEKLRLVRRGEVLRVTRLVPEPSHGGRSVLGLFRRQVVLGSDFDLPLPGFEDLGG